MSMYRSTLKFLFFLALIFAVGGVAGVVFDHELIPRLAAMPGLQKIPFLKRATETVTVINKTEQVIVREDDTVERLVSQPATAVVNIITLGAKTDQRTGVLLTNDGLVVTYADPALVDPSASVTILLFDGTNHPARFLGADPLTNLVYYHIDGVNTPAIALANSDDARVGKKLVAIGNSAAEYQNRLSVGILGNRNRTFNLAGKTVASSEKWEGVFEMDAPQVEDFVGGPAIGYSGEMVGLIGNQTLDGKAYFFLIPANAVRESLQLAISGALTTRPMLGIYYLSLTKAYAIAHNLARDRGALIYAPSATVGKPGLAVLSGSPAEKAGLRYGDIIIAVDGTEVNLDNPLADLLGHKKKGETIELKILRTGGEQTISVEL